MTAPAALPETIRAHVHEDAINRVTRFFTSSSTETLGELLQNARRAHATKVEVTVKDGTVTVKDDGDGIHNPEAILGFGHADWDAGTTGNEDPAGMGFYSLSNYEGVSVHSRIKATGQAWRVELSTDHFLGKSPATVQRLEDDSRHGTTITFQDEHAKTDHVASAARYFPLPVNCNGEQMPRHDFLRDAAYTAEWEGIRIGVFKNAHRYLHPSYDQINFHGITASGADLPSITDIDGERWRTLADVQECPQLMLALPARRQVIQNSFLEELQHQCLRAIYQAVLEDPAHIDLGYEDYTQAHRMGIPVEEAKPLLQEWEADKTPRAQPLLPQNGKAQALRRRPHCLPERHPILRPADTRKGHRPARQRRPLHVRQQTPQGLRLVRQPRLHQPLCRHRRHRRRGDRHPGPRRPQARNRGRRRTPRHHHARPVLHAKRGTKHHPPGSGRGFRHPGSLLPREPQPVGHQNQRHHSPGPHRPPHGQLLLPQRRPGIRQLRDPEGNTGKRNSPRWQPNSSSPTRKP